MNTKKQPSKTRTSANTKAGEGCPVASCSSFLFQFQDSAYGWQGGKFHDDDEQPEKSKKSLEGAKRWARSFIKKNGGCIPIGGKVRIVGVTRTVVIESKWDSFPTNAGGMARELAAPDSESPTKQNG